MSARHLHDFAAMTQTIYVPSHISLTKHATTITLSILCGFSSPAGNASWCRVLDADQICRISSEAIPYSHRHAEAGRCRRDGCTLSPESVILIIATRLRLLRAGNMRSLEYSQGGPHWPLRRGSGSVGASKSVERYPRSVVMPVREGEEPEPADAAGREDRARARRPPRRGRTLQEGSSEGNRKVPSSGPSLFRGS